MQKKYTGEKFGPEKIAQYLIRIVQRLNLAEKKNLTCTIINFSILAEFGKIFKWLLEFFIFSIGVQTCRFSGILRISGDNSATMDILKFR